MERNKLILILEYGHTEEMDQDELNILEPYSLSDIIEIRTKSGKSATELEIENVFMRYYMREYRVK